MFEDFWFEHLGAHALANHSRYALGIPFGHDAGDEQDGAGSELMRRYRNGGTPWFILIDPDGRVVYNHFESTPTSSSPLKRLENEPAAPEPWARHVDLERSDSTGGNRQPDATAPELTQRNRVEPNSRRPSS